MNQWKVRRPTAKHACLNALSQQPWPITARQCCEMINGQMLAADGKPLSQRSAESRLCDLERTKMVVGMNIDGEIYRHYTITPRGVGVLKLGEGSIEVLRCLDAAQTTIERDRADDLRPKWDYWNGKLDRELGHLSDLFFPHY